MCEHAGHFMRGPSSGAWNVSSAWALCSTVGPRVVTDTVRPPLVVSNTCTRVWQRGHCSLAIGSGSSGGTIQGQYVAAAGAIKGVPKEKSTRSG
jgi:hypothetical protein